MKYLPTLAAGLLIGAAALQFSTAASGQGDGWIKLIDGNYKAAEWSEVGKANWELKDGALMADKLDSKDPSYLVSKESYKDFVIQAEFWADDAANSGIFIRCDERAKIDAKICYEVNIFDKRPDPTYGTGAIVDVAKVDPMPKAGGKWNTYEITAQGVAAHRRPEWAEDGRRAGFKACRGSVRASIRLGRDQVPQGLYQAAVGSGGRKQPHTGIRRLTRLQRVGLFVPDPGGANDSGEIGMRGHEFQRIARG